MADQTSEKTLASTISSSDQLQPTDSVSTETASSGSLSRNSSFSKLSALAPEFIPRKTTPPPTPLNAGDPMVMIVPPPPPPPPAMVHVFPPQVNSPFPAMPLPHIDHHHQQQQHHHHQQQQHYPHQNHHSHHHRNDSHRNHHHKNHHQQQQLHGGNNGEQKEGVGQGSNQQYKDQGQGSNGGSRNKNGLSEESTQKLINQVEFYFSDVNLATTDHLIKFINKDPEGFVPISVVASFKKIKALISSNSQLAAVLKKSTKLIVSEDGKKVKRVHPLTGSDMEELQSRIIVAENLPEDHCHQNLMKVFSTVGSVKSIRTCQPQPTNNVASSASRPSKADNGLSCNKVHAFVEYESAEFAEKAITELNEEDDWRNGLKVRPLLKHGSKTVQVRWKKSVNEGEGTCEEYASTSEQKQNEKQSEDFSGQPDIHSHEHSEEPNVEKEGGQKKGRNRGRGKGRGRGHHNHQQNNRAHHVGSPPVNNAINGEHPIVAKQQPPGPRMPDGTRGFSMGRGKPAAVNST